ncbi:hypothetical protein RhiirA4_531052 [Rhizophagus irregularis]|uniref:Ion transport domain-containing protein n=1 Tax=Rhizophagus irregularis TaxID=588596 RepID=A0A2I1GVK7_9GLOM|nr:hypothetical protein RhiirA4_531052 [Rhizophagus irregularis]
MTERDNKKALFKRVADSIRAIQRLKSYKTKKLDVRNVDHENNKKGNYQIAICQNGEFAVTFDTDNLQIKVLKNTDYRPTKSNHDKSDRIDKTIVHFKINDDLIMINKESYDGNEKDEENDPKEKEDKKIDTFKWSLDISNSHKEKNSDIILVAISRININEDMKKAKEKKNNNKKHDYEKETLTKVKDDESEACALTKVKDDESEACALTKVKDDEGEACDTVINIQSEQPAHNEHNGDRQQVIYKDTRYTKKGIAIYRLEIKNQKEENEKEGNKSKEKESGEKEKGKKENYVTSVTCYYSHNISGICRFIEVSNESNLKSSNDSQLKKLKRFIILNFHGIYNFEFNNHFDFFKLNEKFEYPKIFRRELDNLHTRDPHDPADLNNDLDNDFDNDDDDFDNSDGCMKRLLSCIYGKYFLVTQYKNDVRSLEVYNLEKMELETVAKKDEKNDEFINKHYSEKFSVGKLQLCFTQGMNIINLFYMENGLQIISKTFEEIKQICLLEFIERDKKLLIIGKRQEEKEEKVVFIIWDLYNTGKLESTTLEDFPIKKFDGTHLARTSGNILQIKNDGTVSSVLSKVENKLQKPKEEKVLGSNIELKTCKEKKSNGKTDKTHNLHYDEKIIFEPIVTDKEPWVLGDYDRHSYCLYHDRKGTEVETLQLIVGRSTVQIWHQIQDNSKSKDELPNKGRPFLEYIWANRIPINQERKETRLRIEKFECGPSDGSHVKFGDFHLKVYWYERYERNAKKEKHEIINEEKNEINEIEQEFKEINEDGNIDETEKEKRRQVENKEIIEIEQEFKKINEDGNIDETEKEKRRQEIIINKEIIEIEQEFKEINEDGNMDETEKEKRRLKIINNSVKVKRKEKVIKRREIIEKYHAIRHACKALEHLNKRYKSDRLANNYIRINEYERMISYIEHIVWRFAKYEPESFKMLDVRHNLMKNLIISDCDHLIKFMLFGDEEIDENKNEKEVKEKKRKEKRQKEAELRYIPCNELWPGKKFLREDDLDFDKRNNDKLEDNETIKPENIMELAIYHCKGRELNDTIMVAYLLEYYSTHATDCAGWMCTVSKAIPLLFKYNYDDYARKLFLKECFANQDHFSAQDPNEIIPKEYLARRNHNIKFRAFRPIVKLRAKVEWYDYWIRNPIKSIKSFSDNVIKFKNYIITKYENLDNNLGKSPLALRVVPLPDFTKTSIKRKNVEYKFFKIFLNLLWFIFIPRGYQIGRSDRIKLSPFSRMVYYENNDDIYDNPAIEAVINFRWQKARNFFFFLFLRFLLFAICFVLVSWSYLNHGAIINGNSLLALIIIFYYLAFYQFITEVLQLTYRGFKKYFGDIFNFFDIISIVFSVTAMSMMVKNFRSSDGFGSVKEIDSGIIVWISFSIFFLWIELILYLRLISITTYFWIGGDMAQREKFDSWTVDIFTLIGSIVLVVVLQNMLIAFMSGVYEKAEIKGRQTLLRRRANLIADYEALHHIHFWEIEPEPKHIYYFGQSKTFEDWYVTRKNDQGAIYNDFEEKSTFTKRNFEKRDYDDHSIWSYDDDHSIWSYFDDHSIRSYDDYIKTRIENFKNIGFKDKNSIEEIKEIEDMKINLKAKVEKLCELEKSKSEE